MCATCGCEGTSEETDNEAQAVEPVEQDQDEPALAASIEEGQES